MTTPMVRKRKVSTRGDMPVSRDAVQEAAIAIPITRMTDELWMLTVAVGKRHSHFL